MDGSRFVTLPISDFRSLKALITPSKSVEEMISGVDFPTA
jgi:hypothetical protein